MQLKHDFSSMQLKFSFKVNPFWLAHLKYHFLKKMVGVSIYIVFKFETYDR
jgi:hypothetical protein